MEKGKKYDSDKLRYDLLDPLFVEEIVKVLTVGAKKYSPDNWRRVEDGDNRYYAAACRHFAEYRKYKTSDGKNGNRNDVETGLHSLAHTACGLYFLFMKDIEDEP